MEALKSYLYVAMLAALVSSIVIRISEPRYRKYIRFGAGLCLLLAVTAPLISLSDELVDFAEESSITAPTQEADRLMGEIGRGMSIQIGDLVAHQFAIPRERIRVKLTLDLADLTAIAIVRVDLTISGECDAEAIEAYLSSALGCPAQVAVIDTQQGG